MMGRGSAKFALHFFGFNGLFHKYNVLNKLKYYSFLKANFGFNDKRRY